MVDDHQMVREGLSLMLKREPGLEIVGGAESGAAAVAQAQELAPDLVLMDMRLEDINGIEAARGILATRPATRILLLSGLMDSKLINEGIAVGLKGFLLKTNTPEELVRAIHAVMNGHCYLCPEAAEALLTHCKAGLTRNPTASQSLLTDRERDVLKLTAEGLRMKDIATSLNIGVKTVEAYRYRLMKKLECGSSADLTRYAIREGFISV
jgi:DNA-binding NarL/FixJ family response regulator